MNLKRTLPLLPITLVLCLGSGSAIGQSILTAQLSEETPARWYQPDLTPQARFLNSKKEAEAAYKEAQTACKELPKADQKQCQSEAQSQRINDIALARKTMVGEQK